MSKHGFSGKVAVFTDPPDSIVTDGEVSLGLFSGPVSRINARDFTYLDHMDRPVKGLKKLWKIHRFNYFGLVGPRWIIGLAVVDLGYLGNAFIYLYDRNSGEIHEYNRLSPMARGVTFTEYTDQGVISFVKGKVSFRITQDGSSQRRIVDVKTPDLHLSFIMDDRHDLCQPLCLATRNSYSGWTYTQKKAGTRLITGSLTFRRENFDLRDSSVIFDWTAGFLRRDTYWLWSAGVGSAGTGALGFNFSNGVNETVFRENAIWLDGKLMPIGGVVIRYDRFNPSQPWQIHTPDRSIDLKFTPRGARRDKVNTPIVQSNFTQFFGEYSGFLLLDGQKIPVSAFGFAEKHFALW